MSSLPTPAAVRLRLRDVPASHGALWVRQGFRLFMKKPLMFSLLFLSFFFGAFVLMVLPLIGTLVALMALPLLTLGFMLASQAALKGATPGPAVFLLPLRADAQRRLRLIQLGIAYALGTLLIMLLADWADGGSFAELQSAMLGNASQAEIEALLARSELPFGMALRLGLATLLSVPFWHAPALIWWGGQGVAQSLFSSTLTCWRARNAFVVYGVVWALLVALFGLLANIVFALLGSRELIGLAALPAALMFSTVFYVSLYFTFAGCFETEAAATEEALPPPPAPPAAP